MPHSWVPPPEIGNFRLERRLGQGATADVWLARDTLLERVVALKIASVPASAETRTRFRVEARAVAKMQHPNLVAIHHVGELGERPFLVTEYLSGRSLDNLDVPVPPNEVVAIGIDLARGLSAAHRAGVLHRDIKPANAFLGDDGVAKLLDFGLAKLDHAPLALPFAETSSSVLDIGSSPALDATDVGTTLSGRVAGTPFYMAPETWGGEAATRRTDVYSLGALLFELLAGEPPCNALSLQELRENVQSGRIDDLAARAPSAPAALVELVTRCLRVEPAERPSADELCDALARILPRAASVLGDALDDPKENPYRGLRAFGPEHRALFFGREAETSAVIAELRASPFVLVAGPSGTGKSSLVRAGVVPRVEKGALGAGAEWQAVVLVPGRRPIEALARAMAPVLGGSESDVFADLSRSPTWLAGVLRRVRTRLLLVLDQLEEVWTLAPAPERERLFAIVAALALSGRTVRVVGTVRSDFLGRLEDMGDLQAHALRSLVVLRPMASDGLRRAISEPAARRGVTIEPALVERLAAETQEGAGSLPLLEFALGELYARRDTTKGTIGVSDLDALGGVAGALATHADAALARLPPAQRRAARALLLALVTTERTRARREERDLLGGGGGSDARAALDALVEARLVVAGAGEHGTDYEVAHEALLSGWPALRGWLDEEAAARETAERLGRAAAEWERVGRAEEVLFGERQLMELDVLAGQSFERGCEAFVQASRAAVRRARWRRRALAFGIPFVLLLLGGTGWAVSYARHRAAIARAVAHARVLDAKAEETASAADGARAEAFTLFEKDDLGPAETLWKRTRALEEDTDRERRDVGDALDLALALDPRDPGARALYADVTLARLLAAERLHERGLLRELRARLDVYDDGSRGAMLRAPAHVRVETDPPGAALTLARYREDPARRLMEADRALLGTEQRRELEPGSYLVVAEAPGRYPTRYPLLVRRGEDLMLRIVLPRAADVPDGMLYVPAGRTLYGSSDDEGVRLLFLTHQPVHDVEVHAFLIARTEVTNGEYLAFLGALPASERKAHLPGGLTLGKDGRIWWKLRERTLAPGQPYCSGVEPCVDWSRLPVDGASREDGEHFAEWLSRSGRLPGARMCSDREWERAARGGDDRRYANGYSPPGPSEACTFVTYGSDRLRAGPCAAGTHPASRSPFGVEDMEGSEWEWTSGLQDISLPKQAGARSSSWNEEGMYLTISNRSTGSTKERLRTDGLRICADAR